MKHYERILVACPGAAMTASSEALHQLVGEMNRLGQRASITYYPFDFPFAMPAEYHVFRAPVERYSQPSGTLIIFPEILTPYALNTGQADAAIWWMSVDNFTGKRHLKPWRDRLRYWKYVLTGRVPLRGVRSLARLRHFAQSDYAREFLASHGIASEPLRDATPVYSDPRYLAQIPAMHALAKRGDVVLYDPDKAATVTERLTAAYPQWEFRSVRGLDRDQLAQAFLDAKLYIDFSHHPGRDRLLREAALHGCCVTTARHGCAANDIDLPIPSRYKLDVKAPDFVQAFGALAQEVMTEHDDCFHDFDRLRAIVSTEAATFRGDVRALIGPKPAA